MSDRPVSSEPLTAEEEAAETFDRRYQALMDELAESPLPGARYAWDVVSRHRSSIKIATLDALRSATPSSEEDGLDIDGYHRRMEAILDDFDADPRVNVTGYAEAIRRAWRESWRATPDNAGRSPIDTLDRDVLAAAMHADRCECPGDDRPGCHLRSFAADLHAETVATEYEERIAARLSESTGSIEKEAASADAGLAALHAETHDFIARGDIDGLAAAMRDDAKGIARRLARHELSDLKAPEGTTTTPRSRTTGTPGSSDPAGRTTRRSSSPPAAHTSGIASDSRSSQDLPTPDAAGSASSSYPSVSGRYSARSTPSSEEPRPAMAERLSVPRLGTANNAMLPLSATTPARSDAGDGLDVDRLALFDALIDEGFAHIAALMRELPSWKPAYYGAEVWLREVPRRVARLSESTGSEEGA